MSTPLLETRGLAAGYGRVTVVQPTDLSVDAGTVLAVLGPNGAGKTTLLATVAGLLPSRAGSVVVAGETIKSGRPDAASRAGIVLVPDDRALFAGLTVKENLRVAARRGRAIDTVVELFPSLRARWRLTAGQLSGGEQQMLAIARALVQAPRVLLLDEMSMGLAPVIVESLLPVVRRVADEFDAVVILVEQHVGLALDLADQAVVLVHGEVMLRDSAENLRADRSRLESAYLGVALSTAAN
ncbi:MAG TPA: ABC transporter ATP-binding protein [Acidimicrobiales bacterium]